MQHIDDIAPWRITEEPTGEVYRALLNLAASRCAMFSFTREIGSDLGEAGLRVTSLLERFRVESEEEHRKRDAVRQEFLAGLRDVAFEQHYRLTTEGLEILAEVRGLYSWVNPDLPEDLCFHLADGNLWLWSAARQKKSWIEDPGLDLEQIRASVPGLQIEEW